MNNFTTGTAAAKPPTAESLPRSGHVNEVCKEWLVREDGALAYKLQSQEINDFYKGNRYRNAVVREDFPTALHEQIKESEQAQAQVEAYRRRLTEQEEHDKRVAKEIADKLERDLQEQQQKELLESELIAQQMQEIYVNLPPVPPPASRRPPPRPAKASTLQQQQPQQTQTPLQHIASESATSQHARHRSQHSESSTTSSNSSSSQQHSSLQLQQQHFANTDNYVGLTILPNIIDMPTTPSRQQQQQQHFKQINNNHLLVSDVETPTQHQQPPQQQQQQPRYHQHHHHHYHQHQASLTSNTSANSAASTNSSTTSGHAGAIRRNVFEQQQSLPNSPRPPNSPLNTQHIFPLSTNSSSIIAQAPYTNNHQQPYTNSNGNNPIHDDVEEIVEYSDVADSIRQYDITTTATSDALDSTSSHHVKHTNFSRLKSSPSHENLLRTEQKFQKLSPEKYDQLVGNDGIQITTNTTAEQLLQHHADDIELYVDPCDYASLQEIGLPMDEIKEMSKKLKQEQKDALLARRLQELEAKDTLRQEERDRMLAIEAQDKELAKMLQEREKAKAKRAKEKARQRKNQQKEAANGNATFCGTSTHCGPLLSIPQDCMSISSSSSSKHASLTSHTATVSQITVNNNGPHEDPIDVEAYSNPIDVITSSQRLQNGTLTNGSLTRDVGATQSQRLNRDDDIYTLPVDSCTRPAQPLGVGPRPVSLHVAAETVQQLQANAMTRSECFGSDQHNSLNGHDVSPHMKYSKSGNFDQSSSPTPPYMPIQGSRRSNSSEDRKKKSRDNKCTHQ